MRLSLSVAVIFLLLSACAGATGPVISSGDRYVQATGAGEDYRLGSGDKIRISVYNEPTLSGEFSVTADGLLSLPLIGDVKVAGKSAGEVSATIQEMLGNGYLKDPKIGLEIVTYRPFFILGEVKTPGQFPYATGMTALNAIALAQGFSPRAQKSVVYIRQAGRTDEIAYKLTPDLRVLPGDTIRIGERYF